jgi:hypothetical protein
MCTRYAANYTTNFKESFHMKAQGDLLYLVLKLLNYKNNSSGIETSLYKGPSADNPGIMYIFCDDGTVDIW